MTFHKLETTDAFVLFDLDAAERSVGVVRLAPKILRDGAELLARSMTYTFAAFGVRQGGASAGINAKGEARAEALAAFLAEVEPMVADGRLLLDAGKGVGDAELAPLAAHDPRVRLDAALRSELLASGVVAAARTATGGLDGRTVAVEGLDVAGPALLSALVGAGARVVAASVAAGTVSDPAGFTADRLVGPGGTLVDPAEAGLELGPPAAVLAAEADVLVVGSKPGALDHHGAASVTARVVVPSGPVPVTAKGLAVLRRAGAAVLPDFVTAAGPRIVAFPDAPTDAAGLRVRVAGDVAAAVAGDLGHPDGPLLGACYRAEAFLGTWCARLPFGRPLA